MSFYIVQIRVISRQSRMFRTIDSARLLSSLVRHKSASLFSIERRTGICKTTTDCHVDENILSTHVLSNSKALSRNITTESGSDNGTPDMKEKLNAKTDVPADSCDHYRGVSTDVSSPADSPVIKGPPDIPVDCCMSGCANCVWIRFAAEMTEHFSDGKERAEKLIQEIEDPGVRTFLLLELSRMQKPS